MTENRRTKLAQMAELGFLAMPAEPSNVRHQRVCCGACGYSVPYYRRDLAERHECDFSPQRPQGRPKGSGRWAPKPDALQPGEASDRVVAESQGVTRKTVLAWRQLHGVKAGGKRGRPFGSGRWTPKPDALQPGEASDRAVAASQGCSASVVRRWRLRANEPDQSAHE